MQIMRKEFGSSMIVAQVNRKDAPALLLVTESGESFQLCKLVDYLQPGYANDMAYYIQSVMNGNLERNERLDWKFEIARPLGAGYRVLVTDRRNGPVETQEVLAFPDSIDLPEPLGRLRPAQLKEIANYFVEVLNGAQPAKDVADAKGRQSIKWEDLFEADVAETPNCWVIMAEMDGGLWQTLNFRNSVGVRKRTEVSSYCVKVLNGVIKPSPAMHWRAIGGSAISLNGETVMNVSNTIPLNYRAWYRDRIIERLKEGKKPMQDNNKPAPEQIQDAEITKVNVSPIEFAEENLPAMGIDASVAAEIAKVARNIKAGEVIAKILSRIYESASDGESYVDEVMHSYSTQESVKETILAYFRQAGFKIETRTSGPANAVIRISW